MANTTLVRQFGGQYTDWLFKGYVHRAFTARAGMALVIYSATANYFSIWNPQGSGKVFIPMKVRIANAGSTTLVVDSAPSLYLTTGAGAGIATGGKISAWTELGAGASAPQVVNGLLGSAIDPSIKFSVAQTFAAAPSLIGNLGIGTDAWTAASTYPPWSNNELKFDGELGLLPGGVLSIGGNTVATGTAFVIAMDFAVVPISEAPPIAPV